MTVSSHCARDDQRQNAAYAGSNPDELLIFAVRSWLIRSSEWSRHAALKLRIREIRFRFHPAPTLPQNTPRSFTSKDPASSSFIMNPHRTQPYAAFSLVLLTLLAGGHMGRAAQTPSKTIRLVAAADTTKKSPQAEPAKEPSVKLPSGDPCTVLPFAAVQKAFPGAKPGERTARVEKYGLTECLWEDGHGRVLLSVQEFYGRDSAMDEAQSFAMALVDPSHEDSLRNVRREILTGIGLGNEAVALVEARDDKRGIVNDGAMLILHRGDRTLFLSSTVLQERDRAAALKVFEELGRIAAKRLE